MTTLKTSSAIFPVKAVLKAAITKNGDQIVALGASLNKVIMPNLLFFGPFINARLEINVTVLIWVTAALDIGLHVLQRDRSPHRRCQGAPSLTADVLGSQTRCMPPLSNGWHALPDASLNLTCSHLYTQLFCCIFSMSHSYTFDRLPFSLATVAL